MQLSSYVLHKQACTPLLKRIDSLNNTLTPGSVYAMTMANLNPDIYLEPKAPRHATR